jgi:hypothetical protein
VWAGLEVMTRPYYTWKRKLFLLFVLAVVFIPVGPLRVYTHDHNWDQTFYGWLVGVVWAVVIWLIDRFILARFVLEPFFTWRIARFLFKYDYDPEFVYSHWKGEKYHDAVVDADEVRPRTRRQFLPWNRSLIVGWHLLCAVLVTLLGIMGIICGVLKHQRDPDCDRAAWGLTIGTGVMTIIIGILLFLVSFTVQRKLWFKIPWPYIVMHDLWWVIGFFLWDTGTLVLGALDATDESENCPASGTDVARAWLVLWLALMLSLFVLFVIAYILWDLRDLYSRKAVEPSARGPLPLDEIPANAGNNKHLQHHRLQAA